eukprot:TRINITY_DN830_c2_g1_i1.p1 TRINITY_DN830_c2_g1~~TRINITY_DN830_c2_g1_i1.p1  ORF type:complete len:892 (+),score=287.16 TRINITY_DN830_c2_g1_i1:83-2758(+)
MVGKNPTGDREGFRKGGKGEGKGGKGNKGEKRDYGDRPPRSGKGKGGKNRDQDKDVDAAPAKPAAPVNKVIPFQSSSTSTPAEGRKPMSYAEVIRAKEAAKKAAAAAPAPVPVAEKPAPKEEVPAPEPEVVPEVKAEEPVVEPEAPKEEETPVEEAPVEVAPIANGHTPSPVAAPVKSPVMVAKPVAVAPEIPAVTMPANVMAAPAPVPVEEKDDKKGARPSKRFHDQVDSVVMPTGFMAAPTRAAPKFSFGATDAEKAAPAPVPQSAVDSIVNAPAVTMPAHVAHAPPPPPPAAVPALAHATTTTAAATSPQRPPANAQHPQQPAAPSQHPQLGEQHQGLPAPAVQHLRHPGASEKALGFYDERSQWGQEGQVGAFQQGGRTQGQSWTQSLEQSQPKHQQHVPSQQQQQQQHSHNAAQGSFPHQYSNQMGKASLHQQSSLHSMQLNSQYARYSDMQQQRNTSRGKGSGPRGGGGGGGGGFRPISPVDSGSGLQALMAEAQGQATLADAEPGINASLPIPAWYAQQEQGGAAPPIPQPAAAVAKPAPPMGAAVQVTHCTLTESCGLNQTFHMLPKTDVLVLSSVLEDPQVLKMQLAAKGWQTVAQGQMIGVDGQKRITSVVCLKLNNNQIEVVAFEERATCCMATFKFSGQMFRVVGVYVPQQYPEDAAVDLGRWITQCGRKAGCTFIISGLFNYVTSPRVEQVVRAARFRELIRQRPTDIPTKGSLDRVFVARDSTCKLAHPCFPGGRSHAALCCAIPLDGDEGEAAGTLAPAQVVPQVYNPQQASSSIQQVQLLPFAQVPAVPGTTGSPVKAPGAAHAPSAGAAPLPRRSCKVIRLERALRVRFNERHEQRQKGNTEGVATMNREINDIRRKLELVKEAEAASPRGRRK